ncbi:bifunctional diaminohydroxyphosphoribosylaminopyrimidine deaminase/5-amino-6-(5-phosphoribosylamino)uracil reductase RibD, partial [Pelagibacteraceae bacterium]|nr:bifunctional diaminohydroxyphosphoribosylaminopyrimidine deaminase/5-amino-6-(5-phosphoribosylamino)uracil reductase RibD [Pelagibacteraceae bacterium]
MTRNHKNYLNLAFKIAEKNLGKTKYNPSVGTVIVKNNTVISTGVTSINGRPHSEFNALNKKNNFSGADLYTTLEPCTHYGLTPPCTNIIIKKKIKNVYYAFNDPDQRTFKKAKKLLNRKKINVINIKNKNYKNFYSSYFLNRKYRIPFISAKIAISKDFYTINKKSKMITNENSKNIVHLLRSQNDCIFSTAKSINADNSLLNCRIEGLNNYKPDLFIIDLNMKLKKNLYLNELTARRRTFLITKKENAKKTAFFKKNGFKIIFLKSLEKKNEFKTFFKMIYKLGYRRAFFETGITFLNSLL